MTRSGTERDPSTGGENVSMTVLQRLAIVCACGKVHQTVAKPGSRFRCDQCGTRIVLPEPEPVEATEPRSTSAPARRPRRRGPAAEDQVETPKKLVPARDTERWVALGVAGALSLVALVVVAAIFLAQHPSELPPDPPPVIADVKSAAKAASRVTPSTTFGGDRDPNWWAKRQAAIDVPSSELVDEKSKNAPPSDTLAAYVSKEHRVGAFRLKAHVRWREVDASDAGCTLVDDGTVPSLLSVLVVGGAKATLNDLVDLMRRDLPPGTHPSETKPSHEKIGSRSAVGAGFDLEEDGFTVELRAYEATLKGQRVIAILRAPSGGEARREISRILETLE
jgi:hypothetical protein